MRCRSSTAASSTPSPTSAAARTRASPGTRRAGANTSATPSPTSSRRRIILSREGFTRHDRIVAEGGSAGGMLMGAVANMAPEKFGAIIAAVPFVDVLNTMLDDTLPLTPPEWPEWGNPIVSKEDYETIASYSPYDNVAARAYPPILALAGLTDPRVTYWEPAKWIARLQGEEHRRRPGLPQDQHGRRPRRRLRPLPAARGNRLRICLRAEGDGQGRRAGHEPGRTAAVGRLTAFPGGQPSGMRRGSPSDRRRSRRGRSAGSLPCPPAPRPSSRRRNRSPGVKPDSRK